MMSLTDDLQAYKRLVAAMDAVLPTGKELIERWQMMWAGLPTAKELAEAYTVKQEPQEAHNATER